MNHENIFYNKKKNIRSECVKNTFILLNYYETWRHIVVTEHVWRGLSLSCGKRKTDSTFFLEQPGIDGIVSTTGCLLWIKMSCASLCYTCMSNLLSRFPCLDTACYSLHPVDSWRHRSPRHSGQKAKGMKGLIAFVMLHLYTFTHLWTFSWDYWKLLKLPGDSSFVDCQQRQTFGSQSAWSERDTQPWHQPEPNGRSP